MKIADIRVDSLTKEELAKNIKEDLESGERGYVVTPYSEFFVNAQKDTEFKRVLNESRYSTADGFGVIVAAKYLEMQPGIVSMVTCLWKACFDKSFFDGEITEKISGSELIYDVCQLAAENGFRVFFLGGIDLGEGNTGELAAQKIKDLYPNLQIAGTYSGTPSEEESEFIIKKIDKADTDILFVAYGPIKQEKWLNRHINTFKKPLMGFGLGGTFDYVAGSKAFAPNWVRKAGLEGILRPFISEGLHPVRIVKRLNRAWFGIWRFIFLLLKQR